MRGSPFTSSGGGSGGGGAVSSVDSLTGAVDLTSRYVSRVGGASEELVTDTDVSGTYTFDLSAGNYFVLTITGDTTFVMPTVAAGDARGFVVHLFYDGTPRLTWPVAPTLNWLEGATPTFNNDTDGADDTFSFLNEGDPAVFYGLHVTQQLVVPTYLDVLASGEPANPPSGVQRIWFDVTLQHLLMKNSAGTILDISAGSSPPAAGQITQVGGQLTSGRDYAAVGTFSLVLPSTPASGHMVIAVFGTDATGAVTTPAGWTVDKTYAGTQGIGSIMICRLTSTGAVGDKTATFTWSGTHYAFGAIIEYTGQHATPVDKTAQAEHNDTTNTMNVTTAATAQAAELAICGVLTGAGYGGGGAMTWASSAFATVYDSGAGAVGSKALSATGAVTASPTFPTNQFESGIIVTYKAA